MVMKSKKLTCIMYYKFKQIINKEKLIEQIKKYV